MFSEVEKAKFIAVFEEVLNKQEEGALASELDAPNINDFPVRYTQISDSFNLNVLIKFKYIEKFKRELFTFVSITQYGLDRYNVWMEANPKKLHDCDMCDEMNIEEDMHCISTVLNVCKSCHGNEVEHNTQHQ